MVPFLGRGSRNPRIPSPWAHTGLRTHHDAGHPSAQQSPVRQHRAGAACSLPPTRLIQGTGLKSSDPLAATNRLERPRGQNQLSGKTPPIGPLQQGQERRAVSVPSRGVQKGLGQEAQLANGSQKVTQGGDQPSKSLSPEAQCRVRAPE